MNLEIKGKGIEAYRTAFRTGRVKPNDVLFIQGHNLEHYVVVSEEKLDWGSTFEKEKSKMPAGDILSNKNWYVKI